MLTTTKDFAVSEVKKNMLERKKDAIRVSCNGCRGFWRNDSPANFLCSSTYMYIVKRGERGTLSQ